VTVINPDTMSATLGQRVFRRARRCRHDHVHLGVQHNDSAPDQLTVIDLELAPSAASFSHRRRTDGRAVNRTSGKGVSRCGAVGRVERPGEDPEPQWGRGHETHHRSELRPGYRPWAVAFTLRETGYVLTALTSVGTSS